MANEAMREHWTTSAGPSWVAKRDVFDGVFADVNALILDRIGALAGHRVVDVGCGTGSLTRAAAARASLATGVDISPTMIAAAPPAERTAFAVADVQVDDLRALAGAPFTRVVSRFGVMFFDDPVAAFANLRTVVAPGGRLAFVCWRAAAENPMFSLGTSVLLARLTDPPAAPQPRTPGPTAFAEADYVTGVLTAAGWSDAAAEPVELTAAYGFDGSDGVDNRLAMSLGTSVGAAAATQLQTTLSERDWAALLDDVRAEIAEARVDGAVRMPLRLWCVSATAPAG